MTRLLFDRNRLQSMRDLTVDVWLVIESNAKMENVFPAWVDHRVTFRIAISRWGGRKTSEIDMVFAA
jgi:hypothetical protein